MLAPQIDIFGNLIRPKLSKKKLNRLISKSIVVPVKKAVDNKPIYIGLKFHIKPTSIVAIKVFDGAVYSRSPAQKKTNENLLNNSGKGRVSEQSKRKMKAAIDWLCSAAKNKRVYSVEHKKSFYFKVNFITLTFSSTGKVPNYRTVANELLNPFLAYARKYFHLNNYVWKLELTAAGIPHIHITTDTFINHKRLRTAWNRILEQHGYLDGYINKYYGISFDDYLNLYPLKGKAKIEDRRKAYEYGIATGWRSPNTTDIHSTKSINNMAAYMCAYMAKRSHAIASHKGRKRTVRIRGNTRVWSSSYALSSANKCSTHLWPNELHDNCTGLYSPHIKYKKIESEPNQFGRRSTIAEIFFVKPNQWSTIIKGELYRCYNNHLFNIRHNLADKIPDDYYILN